MHRRSPVPETGQCASEIPPELRARIPPDDAATYVTAQEPGRSGEDSDARGWPRLAPDRATPPDPAAHCHVGQTIALLVLILVVLAACGDSAEARAAECAGWVGYAFRGVAGVAITAHRVTSR